MSFSNFAKTEMLTALLTATARLSDGKHRIVPSHNGLIIDPTIYVGADPIYVQLSVYGHNPPVMTNDESFQWVAGNNWPTITEIYITNESTGHEIMLTGTLDAPYPMTLGSIFNMDAHAWEASLV